MNIFKKLFNVFKSNNKQKPIDVGYTGSESEWYDNDIWNERTEFKRERTERERMKRERMKLERMKRERMEQFERLERERLIEFNKSVKNHVNIFNELFDLIPIDDTIDYYNNSPNIDFSIDNTGEDVPIVLNGWNLMCSGNLFRFEKTVIDSLLRTNYLKTKPFLRDPSGNNADRSNWSTVYWVKNQANNQWENYHSQMNILDVRVNTYQPEYCLTITDSDIIRRIIKFRNVLEMKTGKIRGTILGDSTPFSIRHKDSYITLYNVPFLFNRSDYVSNTNKLEAAYRGYIGEWDSGNVFVCDPSGNLYKPFVNMVDNPEIERDEIGDMVNPHRLPIRIMNITDLRPVLKVADMPVN